MIKNKKIVFCIDSLVKGGAERVVSTLANNFAKDNEVTIVTILNKNVEYDLESNIALIELGKKIKKKRNKIANRINYMINSVDLVKKMRKNLNSIKPDIIITFLPEASFISILANKNKYKIIISDRNDPKQEYNNIIYKFLMKKLYPKADGYVFQTHDAKDYFNNIIDFNTNNYEIILNPVNPNFEDCPRFTERKTKIVSVGRLTEQKNMELLIDSFSKMCGEFPEYTLNIYGEGNKREELEQKIKKLNLENKVFLPGVKDDIKNEIYDASLFVMSSNYEGMPNALIEAMVLGLPVISTDCPCGGPRMLIENEKNGYLVKVGDKAELVKTMRLVLSNEIIKENIGKEATKIANLVNINVVNTKWREFIEKII